MPDPASVAILAPLFPLAAFVLTVSATRNLPRVSAGIAVGAVAASLLAALGTLAAEIAAPGRFEASAPWLSVGSLRIDVGVVVDPLSALMLVVVSAVSLLVQLYAAGYMRGDPAFSRFFGYLSLFSASMLTLVAAGSLLLLYMAWELVGLCSYLLIGFWYQRPSAAAAAKKAFVVTRLGDLGFLVGIILIASLSGSFDIVRVESFVLQGGIAPAVLTAVCLLLFTGAMGKSAQFPLHVWLPDAMEGPTPVSALLHSATMVVAGVYLVGRLLPVYQASPAASAVVASVGAFSAIFAACLALVQSDIKKVLAYSTMSQIGYMILSLGIDAYTPAFFHLTTHAAFKTFLFMCAGSVIHTVGTNDIWKMGGLGRRMPVTALFFGIGTLAISGVFPFSGFWSKDEILESALGTGHPLIFAVALATVLLTAFYMARVFFLVFTGKEHHDPHAHAFEAPRIMNVPLVTLAVLTVVLGVIGLPWERRNFHTFLSPAGLVHSQGLNLAVTIGSEGVALAGILLAYLVYGRRLVSHESLRRIAGPAYTALLRKLYMDDLYALLVRGLFLAAARGVAWFDRTVVDGTVNLVGLATRRAGDAVRRIFIGKLEGYALIAFGGVAAVLLLVLLAGLGALR